VFDVFDVPGTPTETAPRIAEAREPSQPEPSEGDKVISAETQKEGGVVEGKVLDKGVPEPKASTSQGPDQDQEWGSPSPQSYWDPSHSAMWIHPDQGYPNPMYSSSSSFHYAQSHYPPGAYFTPMPGYGTPMYGYYQPANPEQTPETYEATSYSEQTAPPPVVVQTVPLPSSRPNTPPRARRRR